MVNTLYIQRPDEVKLVPLSYKYPTRGATNEDVELQQIEECVKYNFPKLELLKISDDWVSIVGYGPSLEDTWKDIKHPLITVSGAHDFMIGHEVIPDWHIECDGREHKTKHFQQTHTDVNYLMATSCHPKMWEYLEGKKVSVYHIASGYHIVNWVGEHDPGSILVAGGSTVGTTAIHLAGILGYRKFKLFGFDGNFRGDVRHAGTHYGPEQRVIQRIANGRIWNTTPQMSNACDELLTLTKEQSIQIQLFGDCLMSDILYDESYGFWNAVLKNVQTEWIEEVRGIDTEAQSRRIKARYNTGTISNTAAVSLRALCDYVHPKVIVEIGTFIGKSTLSMRADHIYTCDKDNDCLESSEHMTCFPYTTSTQMLGSLVDREKCDLFFFDGRIQPQDIPLILRMSTPSTVYAFDDYGGREKGVCNVEFMQPYLKNHRLIRYPTSSENEDRTTIALLVPMREL